MKIDQKIEEIQAYLASFRGPLSSDDNATVSELVVALETAVEALVLHNELFALTKIHLYLQSSIQMVGARRE